MAKPSPWWQQILNQIPESSRPEVKSKTLKLLLVKRFRLSGGWLITISGVVAMLFWNWKLLLATSVGIFVMLLVYLMQEWNWQAHLSKLRRLLSGSNQQLAIAVGSGGIAAVSTYMTIAVWAESDSPWIAAGAILQGLGTLATLILVVWQILSRQSQGQDTEINKILNNLTAVEPLKRLIAVRQLSAIAANKNLDIANRRVITDYFRVMLSQEQEPVIKDAVLDTLQMLDNTQPLKKVAIPLNLNSIQKESVSSNRNRN